MYEIYIKITSTTDSIYFHKVESEEDKVYVVHTTTSNIDPQLKINNTNIIINKK